MNYIQAETIFLNLIRQTEEFISVVVGNMPANDSGSFANRLTTLFNTFKSDKAAFTASSTQLGFLATLLKEYAAFRKQSIEDIGTPEILLTVPKWGDIYDKPATFPPAEHTHTAQYSRKRRLRRRHRQTGHVSAGRSRARLRRCHRQTGHVSAWISEHPTVNVLPETVKIGSTYVLGCNPGELLLSSDETSWGTVVLEGHQHRYELTGIIVLFPSGMNVGYWKTCDGSTVGRATLCGERLVAIGCPFGIGNGVTTCNLPTMTAPNGFEYRMFMGE